MRGLIGDLKQAGINQPMVTDINLHIDVENVAIEYVYQVQGPDGSNIIIIDEIVTATHRYNLNPDQLKAFGLACIELAVKEKQRGA